MLMFLALAFEQQVRLRDGVGFRVHLLPVQMNHHVGTACACQLPQPLLGDGEHPARAARAVVQVIGGGN